MNKEELIIYAIRTSEAIKEEKKQKLIDYVSNLQQENKKYKEVIDKAIKYIEGHKCVIKNYEPYGTPTGLPNYETCDIKGYYKLLDILKEVE